jgi:hypothetical protein
MILCCFKCYFTRGVLLIICCFPVFSRTNFVLNDHLSLVVDHFSSSMVNDWWLMTSNKCSENDIVLSQMLLYPRCIVDQLSFSGFVVEVLWLLTSNKCLPNDIVLSQMLLYPRCVVDHLLFSGLLNQLC